MAVTIEAVRERISYLEDLNARRVGTAVKQQQFELACLSELLALLESRTVTTQLPAPEYLMALEINMSDAECEQLTAALRKLKSASHQTLHTIMSPAPVVPEAIPDALSDEIIDLCSGYEIGDTGAQEIWEACRAAILNGGKP